MASLVRELLLDHATGQLISRPIAEYANLHTEAFVDRQLVQLPPVNGSAATLSIPPAQGGSLDLEVSFDLSSLGVAGSDGEFGVALRAQNDSSLLAGLTLYFNASGPDADGTRMIRVRTTQHPQPTVPAAPLPLLPVLKGERLTLRALIDRTPPTPDTGVLSSSCAASSSLCARCVPSPQQDLDLKMECIGQVRTSRSFCRVGGSPSSSPRRMTAV